MTKAEAGRLGGLSTVQKYGVDHMKRIGLAGATAFWKKYTMQPIGVSGWAIVDRATNKIVNTMSSVYLDTVFHRSETNVS